MNEVTFKGGFKKNSIESILNKKINHWLGTIKKVDADLARSVRNSCFITGGAITSMLLGEQPKDYDVYLDDPQVAKRLVDYYLNMVIRYKPGQSITSQIIDGNRVAIIVKSTGVIMETIDGVMDKARVVADEAAEVPYRVKMITSNAITLSDDLQIITRFVGNPSEVHENFDYIHTTNYFSNKEGLVLNLDAVTATLAKDLKYKGTKYPVASLFRLRKFMSRGWRITAGDLVKISYDISKLDMSDVKVLKDQLIGVDLEYFRQVISKLESGIPVDRSTLFEILNEVFDGVADTWTKTKPILKAEPVSYDSGYDDDRGYIDTPPAILTELAMENDPGWGEYASGGGTELSGAEVIQVATPVRPGQSSSF